MTTANAATPSRGPWTVKLEGHDTHLRDFDGNSLMCDMNYYPWVPENPADWRLMASAPQLLEALKELVKARWMVSVDWAPTADYDAVMDKANEAIKTAEGSKS